MALDDIGEEILLDIMYLFHSIILIAKFLPFSIPKFNHDKEEDESNRGE